MPGGNPVEEIKQSHVRVTNAKDLGHIKEDDHDDEFDDED